MIKKLLLKRPVITLCFAYITGLLILNASGFFAPEKQSFLYYFSNYHKPVALEGKVISGPEATKNGQKFILKAYRADDFEAGEKVLVNCPAAYTVSYGDIIRIEGKIKKPPKAYFPLDFDYSDYLARDGIYAIFDVSYFEHISARPNPAMKIAIILRKDITDKIDSYFKKDYADILKPVVIGDKSSLTEELKNNFIDAGLMHVLVVSGLNVGFIGAIFLFAFKLCGLDLKTASLLSIPFIFLYVLASGANPPVLRAGIMFSCILTALALDREPLIYNSIALSALIILIIAPQQLFTASFQMSYAATIGIIYFYKDIYAWFGSVKNIILKFFCASFAVTLSAQIFIIPVCIYYFGKISVISFAANIFVVPSMGILLYLSAAFYFFTFIFSYAAGAAAFIISIITHIVLVLTVFFGSLSFASVDVAKPPAFQLFLFFAFIFLITLIKSKKRFAAGAILIFINSAYLAVPACYDRGKTKVDFYYSKNAAAVYVKDGSGEHFTLYQTGKYYDKYFIEAFGRFVKYKGIKKPDVLAVGFKESHLQDFDFEVTSRR